MNETNRPITSREYKLMLNTERFRDRSDGTQLYSQLLNFLVESQGNEVVATLGDLDEGDVKKRTTWYLDTPGFDLRRANITLRVRDRIGSKKRYKVTLKFRAPDRYSAAGRDITCNEKFDDDDIKFEEDVVPPFVSKFAYSISFKKKKEIEVATMKDIVDIFPGLAGYDISPDAPVNKVNGFEAHEVVQSIGQFKLDKMPTERGVRGSGELPEFVVNASLSHWYLQPDQNGYPLVTEFSFGFDANAQDKMDLLEKFPPTVVAGANRLFRDAQNQDGWLAQAGTTKTAYVFDVG